MEAGAQVTYVDEVGVEHAALVTNVFGVEHPSINVVYVADDEARSDSYGRQILRETSVVHQANQVAHGRYWF